MATIGHSYGSEWHLLRWMGRHRGRFDREIMRSLEKGEGRLEWKDFRVNPKTGADEEWKGIDFIESEPIQNEWSDFWPTGRGIHNWDALGLWSLGNQKEWILVEAKAHLGEIASNCNASERGGRHQIEKAFREVKSALGVQPDKDWCTGYYQFANRLAALHFLAQQGVPAHLVFIYFVGDTSGSGRNCPGDEKEWTDALRWQEEALGLPNQHPLSSRIHKLFLPV